MKIKAGILTFLFIVVISPGCSKQEEQVIEEREIQHEHIVNDKEQSYKGKPEKKSLEITVEKAWDDIENFLSDIQDENIESLTTTMKNSAQYNSSQMEKLVALYNNILDFQSDTLAKLDSHQKEKDIFIFNIVGVKDNRNEHSLILKYTDKGLIYRNYIINNFTEINEFGNWYFHAIKEKNSDDVAKVLHLDEVKDQDKIQKLFDNYDNEFDIKSLFIKELSFSNKDAMSIEFILADGNDKEHTFRITQSGSYITISDSFQGD